jgi:hypothetical protein
VGKDEARKEHDRSILSNRKGEQKPVAFAGLLAENKKMLPSNHIAQTKKYRVTLAFHWPAPI